MLRIWFLFILSATLLWAKGTIAGTVISNVATLDFEVDNEHEQIQSNVVTDVVAQLIDLHLDTRDAQPVTVSSTEKKRTWLSFRLTNTGNGPDTFTFDYDLSSVNSERPAQVLIYVDTNRNETFDDADRPVDRLILQADESRDIFAVAEDFTRCSGEVTLTLIARSLTGGSGVRGKIFPHKGVNGVDAVDGEEGGIARVSQKWRFQRKQTLRIVQKSTVMNRFGHHEPISGATITYHITVFAPEGFEAHHVLYKNPIPEHTTYVKCSILYNGQPVSDSKDGDAGYFDAKNNLIIVDLGDVNDKRNADIRFKVTIK